MSLINHYFIIAFHYCNSNFVDCVFIADYWSSSEIILHCKPEDYELLGKEHAFVLINHCYETDWLFLWALCEKLQILGGARGFGKNMIKHIPIAGWFFNLAGHIFLARDFEKDKNVIDKKMKTIMSHKFPAWVRFYFNLTYRSQ